MPRYLLLSLLLALPFRAQAFNLPGLGMKDLPAQAAEAPAPTRAQAEWTVMVYMNGKNNLEAFGLADVNEMEMVGSSDRLNVVVELARSAGNDISDGDWKGSRRFLVKKDANPARLTSPVLAEMPQSDMGDWRHLAEFARWGKQNFPAKRYMLVVWNHGNGWKGRAAARGISTDDETGHTISTGDLGRALVEAGPVDLFGMDACIMQMAEVAWEVKDNAAYILASEEVIANEGQRYDLFLDWLARNPAAAPAELGHAAVSIYADHYTAVKRYGTMSLIRAAALPGFAALLDAWTAAVMEKHEKLAVSDSRGRTQQFWYDDNIDIYHLVQLTTAYPYLNRDVAAKGRALTDFMDKELVVSNRWITGQYSNAHGLAVYMPRKWLDPAYNALNWSKHTGWARFCAWMLGS
ncbi:MAG: hypothetical protein HY952_03875 [Elusimicrobia bacterium]|nr:hypothetical protein [Elusimicrobiota bacterium]